MMDGWMDGSMEDCDRVTGRDALRCLQHALTSAKPSTSGYLYGVRSTARALRASAMVLSRCPGCYPVKPVLRKSHIAHRATKDGYRCLTGRSTHSS